MRAALRVLCHRTNTTTDAAMRTTVAPVAVTARDGAARLMHLQITATVDTTAALMVAGTTSWIPLAADTMVAGGLNTTQVTVVREVRKPIITRLLQIATGGPRHTTMEELPDTTTMEITVDIVEDRLFM